MKNLFNNIVKNSIKNHYFDIEKKEDMLLFKLNCKKLPFCKKFLMITNRKTGKRILKELNNSKTSISFKDFEDINENGIFDIYLYVKIFGRFFIKRSNYGNEKNNGVYIFNNENKLLLSSFQSKNNNLSLKLKNSLFQPFVTSVKIGKKTLIEGTIRLFDNVQFNKIELLAKSDKTGRKSSFCEYSKENNNINFSCILDNNVNQIDIGSKWNVYLRLINDDYLISSEKLIYNDLIKIKDNLIIDKLEVDFDENKLFILFYISKKLYFEFKIITKKNYLNSIKREKNKKLYNNFKNIGLNDNYIFFESFHGKYNNNPKYLYEKMLELGFDEKYQFIWAYDGKNDLPGNPIVVKSNSKDYFKYLSQSKYRINNTTFPVIDNNDDIVFIQTWHGTPLKRLAKDINIKHGVSWNHFNKEVNTWDYLISANEYSSQTFKRAFRFKNQILEVGYPANDIFYLSDVEKKKIKNKFNVPKDKKIILYAPTFRDNKKDENGNRIFDFELNLEKLYEHLSSDYFLIIKTHYVISEKLIIDDNLKDFVVDLSDYEDIHELFILSDILITDYSSSFFDFAHSKKPILFFMSDLKTYMDTRGLYAEVLMQLPGPILINNDEVIKALINMDKIIIEYESKYSKFYNKFCQKGKGYSSKNIIQQVWGDNIE